MSLPDQVRELGRLLRNVEDAAARIHVMELEPFAAELADWARAATTLLTQVAIEQAQQQAGGRDRTKTSPEGYSTMAELVDVTGVCTFEDADCQRCTREDGHPGACSFPARRQDVLIEGRR